MKTIFFLLLIASIVGAQAPQSGPRGGCYIIVTGKNGKTYKRYIDKALCKKGGK